MHKSVPSSLIVLGVVVGSVLWGCAGQSTDPEPPRVTSVLVTSSAASLTAVGATEQLVASARDQGGNVVAGAAFTWASTNQTVATVSSTGLVTAVGGGSATVTATTSGVVGSVTITVTLVVASVEVSSPAATLTSLGETAQLVATAMDSNANEIAGKTLTWASSDDEIVSVDDSGQVTAVANGSASITATTDGVSGTVIVPVDQQAAGLAFELQPGVGESGGGIVVPAPSVAVRDALGSTVLGATDEVTVALGGDAGGATLIGTTSVAATDGVALFEDLSVDRAGVAYRLVASSGDLTPTTSEEFTVLGLGVWALAGPLAGARSRHTSAVLTDGRVLVVGGEALTAEIYDPVTGVFTLTGAPGAYHGSNATATRLQDGRVLVVGGHGSTTSAEVFDPATGAFSPIGDAVGNRAAHSATLLPDGRVLLAGGQNPGPLTHSDAEIYDPATGTFASTGSLADDRSGHSATLLSDGRVLIAGGTQTTAPGTGIRLATAEIYDPVTGTFSMAGSMAVGRTNVRATLLNDGTVLVLGSGETADLFDPTVETFRATGSMEVPHDGGTVTRMSDGRVLVAGGLAKTPGSFGIIVVELYDPAAGVFLTLGGTLNQARHSHKASVLEDGSVLLSGGYTQEVGILTSVEVFRLPEP